ncbi:MAG TPA: glycosyltransferase family 2 protein [Clostridiaceae bacterium]|nr:glycosyltransferase family 2 protein [Clostridiaceae bacterium]
MISLIIPVYNEEKYIEKCINSIIDINFPALNMEALFIDGMSTDKSRDIILEYANKYPFIKLIDNHKRVTPAALNIGIENSMGKYIVIISAHSILPEDAIINFLKFHEELQCDAVGGNCITKVLHENPKSCSIIKVLSNKFGVGNSSFRTKKAYKPILVDTVPFGCYRKDVFYRIGLFDERLIRNQDIEFSRRIINSGGEIYLIPNTEFIYYARENYKDLAKNNLKNGLWNILTVHYTNTFKSLSLRHFIPFIFILSLIVPSILSLIMFKFIYPSLLSFLAYNLLIFAVSLKLNDNTTKFVYLVWAFYTLHFSYGFGSLIGIFKVMALKFKYKK